MVRPDADHRIGASVKGEWSEARVGRVCGKHPL